VTLVEPKPKPRPWFALWRRESGSFQQLPLIARALFAEILKLTDDNGVIEIGDRLPADAVAWALGADRSDRRALAKYVPMLIADGCLVHEGDKLIAPSFGRWQPKERTRPPSGPRSGTEAATKQPRTSRDSVTIRSRHGHDGAGKSAEVLNSGPESRVEESRVEYIEHPPTPQGGAAQRVFDRWRELFGHPKAQLDAKRRRLVERAIKSHGEDTCVRSLEGYSRDPFTLGENDRHKRFDELELLLRDAQRIERGLELAKPAAAQSDAKRKDGEEREWRDELYRLESVAYKL
jgi:hypothetical protein